MKHRQLVAAACKWLRNVEGCAIVLPEFRTWGTQRTEIPDVIGWRVSDGADSVVVECKASRADFLADRKKEIRLRPELGMGHHRWYFCPPGIAKAEEALAVGWGLVEYSGGAISRAAVKAHPRAFQETALRNEVSLLVQALRRETGSKRWARVGQTIAQKGKEKREERLSKLPPYVCPYCSTSVPYADRLRHVDGCDKKPSNVDVVSARERPEAVRMALLAR